MVSYASDLASWTPDSLVGSTGIPYKCHIIGFAFFETSLLTQRPSVTRI